MAILTGTNGIDNLYGTEFEDTFFGNDGNDILILGGARFPTNYYPGKVDYAYGGNGSDEYRPAIREIGGVVIEDNGTVNSSADAITYLGSLVQTGRLGYIGFSTFEHVGDDLQIVTAFRPTAFRKPGLRSVEIQVINQYAADGTDKIEYLDAGGVRYNLITGTSGTANADILAGTSAKDTLKAGDGTDYVTGNGGNDKLILGLGDDYGFGGQGNDKIYGGAGFDRIYGGNGNDKIFGGNDVDFLYGEDGKDKIRAGGGDDWVLAGAGNDKVYGNAGNDHITGGDGDDLLVGGTGSDTYIFIGPWGNDVINDKGSNQVNGDKDTIELRGYFGPGSGSEAQALDRLSIARNGNNMVLSTTDGSSTLTVLNQFAANDSNKSYIENLYLNGAYWPGLMSRIVTSERQNLGDDRGFWGTMNEVMFGDDTDNQFFGDSGTNLIWTGGGADVLIYKQVDNFIWYGSGGSSVVLSSYGSSDVVMDFDLTLDKMDFTEITSITSMADLTITTEADGNARIVWLSGDIDVATIDIDLRGVAAADLTAANFIFIGNANPNPNPDPNPNPNPVGNTISGTQDDDVLTGTAADDVIIGFGGVDIISAGAGDDNINGGAENDILTGGNGNDTFVFGVEDGADIVTDFASGVDHIQVAAGEFINTAADALARVTYSAGNAILDITGGEHIVTFEGVTSLTIDDIIIV